MKKVLITSSALALIAATPIGAQSLIDWTGSYVGGTIGTSDIDGDVSGDGALYGGAGISSEFDTALDMGFDSIGSGNVTGSFDTFDDVFQAMTDDDTTTTLIYGHQVQVGTTVYGGEARLTFGGAESHFGGSFSSTVDFDDSRAGEFSTFNLIGTAFGNMVPESPPVNYDPEYAYYEGSITQSGEIGFGIEVDGTVAAVGRAGHAVGNALFFVMGGVGVAKISSMSYGNVTESGSFTGGTDQFDTFCSGATCTDEWSHSFTNDIMWSESEDHTNFGVVIGAGVDYAVTPNTVVRFEVEHFNYGSVEMSGMTSTGGSYSMSQDIKGTRMGLGVLVTF